jgi:hypothetical protein
MPPIFDILLTLKRLAVSDIVCITPIADLGEIAAEFKPDSTLAMVSAKLESTLCQVALADDFGGNFLIGAEYLDINRWRYWCYRLGI